MCSVISMQMVPQRLPELIWSLDQVWSNISCKNPCNQKPFPRFLQICRCAILLNFRIGSFQLGCDRPTNGFETKQTSIMTQIIAQLCGLASCCSPPSEFLVQNIQVNDLYVENIHCCCVLQLERSVDTQSSSSSSRTRWILKKTP